MKIACEAAFPFKDLRKKKLCTHKEMCNLTSKPEVALTIILRDNANNFISA